MELLSMYLINALSIPTTGLPTSILTNLKNLDWFADQKAIGRFVIMNKRYDINGTLYRAMIRFQAMAEGLLKLDMPVPFLVAQLEQDRSVSSRNEISLRFKDIRAWHGREMKTTVGFLQAGVPVDLINQVQQDMQFALKPQEAFGDLDISAKGESIKGFPGVSRSPILMIGVDVDDRR